MRFVLFGGDRKDEDGEDEVDVKAVEWGLG